MQRLTTDVSRQLSSLCRAASGPIGLGVSGGSDSLALLYLCADWARVNDRVLVVFTVDHGLRAEARDEAAEVAAHADRLGLVHRTVCWRPEQGRASQAKARRARHALLGDALRGAGGTHLLLGHTRDDQIETAAMRAARPGGEDGAGLAAMRPLAVSPVWPQGRGVFIARPCLGMDRDALRAVLRERGITWAEDPSNEDLAYERVRVRRELAKTDIDRLVPLMGAAAEIRRRLDISLSAWLLDDVDACEDGLVHCRPAGLDAEALAEGLGWLIMAAAGGDSWPDRGGRRELARDILKAPGQWRARTLGGAWIAPRQGRIHIAREPGRVPESPGKGWSSGDVWDGRFRLAAPVQATRPGTLSEQLAPNVQADLHTDMLVSPMARAGYPDIVRTDWQARCLARSRLEDVRSMLNYEKLSGNPS